MYTYPGKIQFFLILDSRGITFSHTLFSFLFLYFCTQTLYNPVKGHFQYLEKDSNEFVQSLKLMLPTLVKYLWYLCRPRVLVCRSLRLRKCCVLTESNEKVRPVTETRGENNVCSKETKGPVYHLVFVGVYERRPPVRLSETTTNHD